MVSITNADRVFSEQYMIHENDKYKTIPKRNPALITEETVMLVLEPAEYLHKKEVIDSFRNDDTRKSLSLFSARLLITLMQSTILLSCCLSVRHACGQRVKKYTIYPINRARHALLTYLHTEN